MDRFGRASHSLWLLHTQGLSGRDGDPGMIPGQETQTLGWRSPVPCIRSASSS